MINRDQLSEPDDAAHALALPGAVLPATAYASMRDTLGGLVDAVAEIEKVIASATAWRTQLIDCARMVF